MSLDVLLFTGTTGFRHPSIPSAVAALRRLAVAEGFELTHSEDGAAFSPDGLQHCHALLLLNNTGDVLVAEQRAAFEAFVQGGGGVVAVHGAAVIDFDWPWYERLIGARFRQHPQPQRAEVVIEQPDHPVMRNLPQRWRVHDEWYDFEQNPRAGVQVLASVDERSYQGGKMGDHPIVWCHEACGGRLLYTGLGHGPETYADPLFLQHLARAVHWVTAR